ERRECSEGNTGGVAAIALARRYLSGAGFDRKETCCAGSGAAHRHRLILCVYMILNRDRVPSIGASDWGKGSPAGEAKPVAAAAKARLPAPAVRFALGSKAA